MQPVNSDFRIYGRDEIADRQIISHSETGYGI
jgi:hypothetical protein